MFVIIIANYHSVTPKFANESINDVKAAENDVWNAIRLHGKNKKVSSISTLNLMSIRNK